MARPKRFTDHEFTEQLDQMIDWLIETKHSGTELIQTDVHVNDIALAFSVYTASLRRWTQEYIGISPRQYLATIRVERAKHLLNLGAKPSKVSQQLAFTEHKVFSTLFKRLEGLCPSTFCNNNI